MNALDLLHLRRRTRPDDHVTAATSPPKPDEGPRPTPPTPTPPAASQPPPIGQAWPSPRTWQNAELTAADVASEKRLLGRLSDLTEQLGTPLAAAQAEFTPHLRKDHRG